METNYVEDIMIVQDIDRYIVMDEETYKWILANINCNYLMILFTLSCVCTLVCSYKKPKNDYVLIQDAKPVHGAIVEETINKV
tara:strand:- start:1264 stop:1512 length:249 start_codon:yes stop_codon:yes gene_type:complete